jgi:hypothetical protein
MRILGIVALGAALAGCGLAQGREAEAQRATALAEANAAITQCNERKIQSAAVAWAKCVGDGQLRLRAFSPAPDLVDQEIAGRNVLSEKWQKGQVTQAEFEFQYLQLHSQLESETQRRVLAVRSVNAQEDAAVAASAAASAASAPRGPVYCNRMGTTTICN